MRRPLGTSIARNRPGSESGVPYGSLDGLHQGPGQPAAACFYYHANCRRKYIMGAPAMKHDRGQHPGYRCAMRCSASIMFLRISLIRVRWPSPFDLSQASTLGSRRTLTGTFGLMSRNRTI